MKEGDKARLLLFLLLFLSVLVPLCFTHSYSPVKERDSLWLKRSYRVSAVGMVEEARSGFNDLWGKHFWIAPTKILQLK
jgi:hypothetical protein